MFNAVSVRLTQSVLDDPLTKLRCDGKVDCEDKSDEEGCRRAVIDSSYNKDMTPQPLSGKYNK